MSLLSFTACEEQVQKGDTLTQAERDYLRARAALKCINGSNDTIEEFYENSNDKMRGYVRGNTWEIKLMKGDVEISTSHIYVWKVTSTNVYFRLRLVEGTTTKNYYLKMDEAINIDMIRNLQREKCNKDLEMDFSSSKMTASIEEPRVSEDSETESEREIDYRIESQFPAFFGTLNRTETKRFYDKDDDDTVTKTEVWEYSFRRFAEDDEPDQPVSYKDPSILDPQYCVIPSTAAPTGSTLRTYEFPFILTNCVETDTAGPDADGDTTPDFNPDTELVI